MNSKVTIYVPTRNRAELLRAALASVVRQSYGNFEVLVVDDASADGTRRVVEELSSRDSRFRVISLSEPGGAGKARNAALKEARGDFITGLDDDDYFEPYHIEALVRHWEHLTQLGVSPSFLYTQAKIVKNDKVVMTTRREYVEADDLFDSNCVGNQIFAPRSHYIEAGLFDENMPAWQDIEFFYRMAKLHGGAYLLDMTGYVFDDELRSDRISSKRKEVILEACSLMYKKHGSENKRKLQRLLLQVYSDFYGFQISLEEMYGFAKLGFWPQGYIKLIARYAKRKAGVSK